MKGCPCQSRHRGRRMLYLDLCCPPPLVFRLSLQSHWPRRSRTCCTQVCKLPCKFQVFGPSLTWLMNRFPPLHLPAFSTTSPPRCMHVDPTLTLTHTFHSDRHHQCMKHHLMVDSDVLLLKSVTCVLKCSLSLLCVPLIGTT